MCRVFGFHRISTQEIRKSFELTVSFPVSWEFSKRFMNINERANSKFSSDPFRFSATSTFSAIGSVHMNQTDRSTAYTVLNILRNEVEPSRMLRQIAIPISEQITVKKNFDEFAADSVPMRPRSVEDVIAIHTPSIKSHFWCDDKRAQIN